MEQRKRRAPGVQAHIGAIKDINNQINTLAERIAEYRLRVDQELRRTSERSESARIRAELRSVDEAARALRAAKAAHADERNTLAAEFNGLREAVATEKRRINFDSLDELERKEKETNYRLMTSRVTPQQEREIGATLTEIKKKRVDLQNLGSKEARVAFLGKRLGELNGAIKAAGGELGVHRARAEALKAELQSLAEKGRTKSDAVVELEKKIDELRKTRTELYERRKAEQAAIALKEEAHDRHLQALAEVQVQEDQKKAVRARIKKLDDDRNALLSEQAEFDPQKFDEIAEALRQAAAAKDLALPIALVQRLAAVGAPLPRAGGDVPAAIGTLAQLKAEFEKTAHARRSAIEARIGDLDAKIGEERRALDAMPSTDVKARREPVY